MKMAAIHELKSRLSEYLAYVKSGNEVLVTDRGTPIAYLVPIPKTGKKRESLLEMQKQGLLKLGPGKLPDDFWEMPRLEDPEGLIMKALLEEREEER